jgi:hypothetical protein
MHVVVGGVGACLMAWSWRMDVDSLCLSLCLYVFFCRGVYLCARIDLCVLCLCVAVLCLCRYFCVCLGFGIDIAVLPPIVRRCLFLSVFLL